MTLFLYLYIKSGDSGGPLLTFTYLTLSLELIATEWRWNPCPDDDIAHENKNNTTVPINKDMPGLPSVTKAWVPGTKGESLQKKAEWGKGRTRAGVCLGVARSSVFSLSGGYQKISSRKEYNMGKEKRKEKKRILNVKRQKV